MACTNLLMDRLKNLQERKDNIHNAILISIRDRRLGFLADEMPYYKDIIASIDSEMVMLFNRLTTAPTEIDHEILRLLNKLTTTDPNPTKIDNAEE